MFYIAGVLTTLFVLFLIYVGNQPAELGRQGLTMFAEKGDVISTSQLKVFQVLEPNMALAHTSESYNGIVVLVVNEEGKYYYDDEIIKIPAQKRVRQVGVYKYNTENNFKKTIPVVRVE